MAFLYAALSAACLRQLTLAGRVASLQSATATASLASGRASRQLDDVQRERQRGLAKRLGFITSPPGAGWHAWG